MRISLKDHFIVIHNGPGPTFVAPHAAIAFRKPGDYQDEGTHYIAYKLGLNGGKVVVSSVTRERDIGIDFYRSSPSQKLAISNYRSFRGKGRGNPEFRKRYAWVARNVEEHKRKEKIFRAFWKEVARSKGGILFVHRQYLNPIRHPSLIDIVPFTQKEKIKAHIEAMNKKHSKFFTELLPLYQDAFRAKTQSILFKRSFGKQINTNVFNGLEPQIEQRVARFKEKIERMPYIKITCMQNFKGTSVRETIEHYLSGLDIPILQIELSEFLTKNHPEIAIYLLNDLLKRVNHGN